MPASSRSCSIERAAFGATYFHNGVKNLIEFAVIDPFTSTLINIGHATTYGVESFAAYKPSHYLPGNRL